MGVNEEELRFCVSAYMVTFYPNLIIRDAEPVVVVVFPRIGISKLFHHPNFRPRTRPPSSEPHRLSNKATKDQH